MIMIQNIQIPINTCMYEKCAKIKSQKLFLIGKIGDILKLLVNFHIAVHVCTLSFRNRKIYVGRQDTGVREVKIQISN